MLPPRCSGTKGLARSTRGSACPWSSRRSRADCMTGIEMSHSTFGSGTSATDLALGMSAQLVSSIAYVPRDIVVERCAIDGQIAKQVGSTASSLAALKTIFDQGRWALPAFVPHSVGMPFNGIFMWALGRCKQVGDGERTYIRGVGTRLAPASASCINPIDVKTRMQIAGANTEVFAYSGPADCLKQLMKRRAARLLRWIGAASVYRAGSRDLLPDLRPAEYGLRGAVMRL